MCVIRHDDSTGDLDRHLTRGVAAIFQLSARTVRRRTTAGGAAPVELGDLDGDRQQAAWIAGASP